MQRIVVVSAAILLILQTLTAHTAAGDCKNYDTYFVEAGLSTSNDDPCSVAKLNTSTQFSNFCAKCQARLETFYSKLDADKNCTGVSQCSRDTLLFDSKSGNYCAHVLIQNAKGTQDYPTFYDLYGEAMLAVVTNGTLPSNLLASATSMNCTGASYCYVTSLKGLTSVYNGHISGDDVVSAFARPSSICGVTSSNLAQVCLAEKVALA
jgi:hypothetical protein